LGSLWNYTFTLKELWKYKLKKKKKRREKEGNKEKEKSLALGVARVVEPSWPLPLNAM
jgi:hypothetical protein